MEDRECLPEAIKAAQRSLNPFVKQRQEAAHIRRVLAAHLSSHMKTADRHPVARPLSLVDPTSNVDSTPHGVRGFQRDYIRCVRANVNARKEYAKVRKEHRIGLEDEAGEGSQDLLNQDGTGSSMELFVELVRQRQKHERLRIIQDYVDVLAQKPAAAAEHLDPKAVLKDVESLPKIPSEVLNTSSAAQGSTGVDIKELVDELEKSVLRAKLQLKREQNLLAKVKAENTSSAVRNGSRLEAVGMTRSVLINWIEAELARSGEAPPDSDGPDLVSPDKRGKQYIDSHLVSIHRQYARYTKARQALIVAATEKLDPPSTSITDEESVTASAKEEYISNGMEITHSYLEEMASILNEQKAMNQQKSHLTISLAKQLKEASQGLDRLADESHLIPAHPMPVVKTQRKGLEGPVSFGDEMSNHEKPDSSRRARAWVFAAESAGASTKDVVSEKVEEGGMALVDAQQSLVNLRRLLGTADDDAQLGSDLSNGNGTVSSTDIWAVLDGNLGVIKGDSLE